MIMWLRMGGRIIDIRKEVGIFKSELSSIKANDRNRIYYAK